MYPPGTWNDVNANNYDAVYGYVVEFEPASAVPEPATLMLLGGGLAGLAIWGRYRARRS